MYHFVIYYFIINSILQIINIILSAINNKRGVVIENTFYVEDILKFIFPLLETFILLYAYKNLTEDDMIFEDDINYNKLEIWREFFIDHIGFIICSFIITFIIYWIFNLLFFILDYLLISYYY